jgi:hypothetical protein
LKTLQKTCTCSFQERLPFSGRKFLSRKNLSLHGYCDASWSCEEDGFSITGFFQSFDWTTQLVCKRGNQQLLYLLLKLSTVLYFMLFRKQFG